MIYVRECPHVPENAKCQGHVEYAKILIYDICMPSEVSHCVVGLSHVRQKKGKFTRSVSINGSTAWVGIGITSPCWLTTIVTYLYSYLESSWRPWRFLALMVWILLGSQIFPTSLSIVTLMCFKCDACKISELDTANFTTNHLQTQTEQT